MKQQLGPTICEKVLVIHALLGYQTTSSMFGIGKAASLKKLSSRYFLEQVQVFDGTLPDTSQVDIIAEEKMLLLHYIMEELSILIL